MKCAKCGRETEMNGAAFCPFCGAALEAAAAPNDEKVTEWLGKIAAVASLPEKKKVIEKAREALPNCPEIEWEALFIGHEKKHKRNSIDFSIVKSYLLQLWLTPKEFDRETAEEIRTELFGDPQLIKCLEMAGDRQACLEAYLKRLSAEFIDVFLDGSTTWNGSFFGFRMDKRKEKTLAVPAARVILNVRKDEGLTGEQREVLERNFYAAFKEWSKGATQWLEEELNKG